MSSETFTRLSGAVLLPVAAAILLHGLITGFFYAYSSSVMFGLDVIDPRHAISAMQGINREVRNIVFAPAFFGTPLVSLIAAAALYATGATHAALAFLSAALIYICAAMIPTMSINVPMNEALAIVRIPDSIESAQDIWTAYATRWSFWNAMRTVGSAVALLAAACGIYLAASPNRFNSVSGAAMARA